MNAKLHIDRNFIVSSIDRRIFGGFIEHLGRAVYGGIYEPGHPEADANGFRNDVAALVRDLDMPVTRYPGGNFVSGFDWHDSIGPVKDRPRRPDYAWFAMEPNQIGIDEFVQWCRKVNTVPMMAVNLGTGTAKSAQELVEYCNFEKGSSWSDLRRANGAEKPHAIRMWCLGNEMDGQWQIEHKTALEYGRAAHEAGKMMKMVDSSIELVVCGSSGITMPTFAEWDAQVLDECFDIADFISLHAYYTCGKGPGSRLNFLASPDEMEFQIQAVAAVCDYVSAKHKSDKKIMLSFDEWNVWSRCERDAEGKTLWQVGRPIVEDIYNMADVLVVGGCLMTLLNHADRVKTACIAQTVNAIAPIMTRTGGGVWKQTTYHPFYYMSKYGRGTVLRPCVETPFYEIPSCTRTAPCLQTAAILSEEENELRIFAVNRSMTEDMTFVLDTAGFALKDLVEAVEIANPDLDAINTETEENVAPETIAPDRTSFRENVFRATLKPASWNMFRIAVEKAAK